MDDKDKRFIEETFPVKEVSKESAKEKNVRHGHISTLHIWWARRPLASSRATAYTALIPPAKDEKDLEYQRKFIIELCKWENSNNTVLIEEAREKILEANNGVPPKVLDPFGGGGSIPLEALRLGCETYSNDINPVAVLIQKCTLEYPQIYGDHLAEDVKKWGEWIFEEAKKEIGRFYPNDSDGSVPLGYIWARTIPCQNPSCGAEIPLMKSFWLAKKSNKNIALYPFVIENNNNREIQFKIVGDGYEAIPNEFNPDDGTVVRAKSICLCCGGMTDDKTTRKLFQEKKNGERMIAVVLHKEGVSYKKYRPATDKDKIVFNEADEYLKKKNEELTKEWGINAIPDEEIKRIPLTFGVINLWIYGFATWGDVYNQRQKLSIINFIDKIRKIYKLNIDKRKSEILISYLALVLSRHTSYSSTSCWWETTGERTFNAFGRQALPMVFDYNEQNPFGTLTGNFSSQLENTIDIIKSLTPIYKTKNNCIISNLSANNLKFEDDFFDAIITDPPYYDNVPYSYLSDYFYIWLKRILFDIIPNLFSTNLTPKNNEIVAYNEFPSNYLSGKEYFEDSLKHSFQEIYRLLKKNGISIIVYAHKSTSGWETLINSLLDSGLIITGAYPINTENTSRLTANDSAALASSIYIISRKIQREPTGFYNEVKEHLKKHLYKRLDRLWEEGISGADFFISAIGSAIEVFGKYENVMDFEGNIIRANRLLEDVRVIATDYAVNKILHEGFTQEITGLTRFYILYRWDYGVSKILFDEARKLAQSCSIDLSLEWNKKGFIKKDKEFISVLGPQDRVIEDFINSKELIDVLHTTLLLWEKGKKEEILKLLKDTNYGNNEAFFRVAQAISETLGIDCKEKKLLDGFLSGRERIINEMSGGIKDKGLFD